MQRDELETLTTCSLSDERGRSAGPPVLTLVVLWSLDEPTRVGEAFLCPEGRQLELGRGAGETGDPRLRPIRMRPGRNEPQPPLASRLISRRQLVVRNAGEHLRIRNVGRTTMLHQGDPVDEVSLRPGGTVTLRNALVLGCVRRPERFAPFRPALEYPGFPFGAPDPYGIVGESAAVWELREQLAFVAGRAGHVLVHGPSGSGKELAGRALHGLAGRGHLVARNAATFPEGLVDAELFGNIADYPNPGMPARPGLVGEADGGTLLLDEIGELPDRLQAHLLRVLDEGEYARLGESTTRRSTFRLIGVTNREVDALKHDLAARLVHRLEVPGLDRRPEDVPLLTREILRRRARGDRWLGDRFFEGDVPRVAPAVIVDLAREDWTSHARQLERRLWEALASSRGSFVDLPPRPAAAPPAPAAAELPGPEAVQAALERSDWVLSRAWRDLGLRNRYQLARLVKRYGLERT